MLGWLRSLFGWSRPKTAFVPQPTIDEFPGMRLLSLDDAVHIAEALRTLPRFGLKPRSADEGAVVETSVELAKMWEGICVSNERTPGDWALFAMSDHAFENAIFFQDHCFDGMRNTDLADTIYDIAALTSPEWPIERVLVNGESTGPYLEMRSPVVVEIVAPHPVSRFELTHAKDFDWSLIYRLNERLPAEVTKKFAMFFDGNATIVFLEPEEIEGLSEYSGCTFSAEEEPTA